jgi:hypothetical protein
MGQELQIPENFKTSKPSQGFAYLDPTAENLSEGIGQSYGVIGYKGKVWSLRYRGEKHNFVRPDDGTPVAHLDVVILGQARHKSKSYYKKYDQGGGSEGERPICASADGITPDLDVQVKQSDNCATCPRNVRKMNAETGRMSRECTDFKRLAVLILPPQSAAILGQALMEPVFLRVPPASLNSLAVLGETMANQGWHFSSYITRITFNPETSWPEMVFRPLQGLTDKEAPIIQELRNNDLVERITGGGTPQGPKALTPPGNVETGLTSTLATAAPQRSQQTQPSTSATTASAQPATRTTMAETTAPAQSTSPTPVDTGFGGVTLDVVAEKVQPVQPATQTFSDTGEPEASDADLDARIAGLIKTG